MNMQRISAKLLPLAWQSYHRGDLANAEQQCLQVLAVECANADALSLLGVIFFRKGQFEAAIAWAREAVRADPANANFLNDLGVFYTQAGRLAEAVDCYEKTLQLRPDYATSYSNLGYALHQMGRFQEAQICSEKAVQLWPDFAEAHNNLGLALLELGDLEGAAEHFQKAIRIQPVMVEAYHNLGSALLEQGQVDEALPWFEQALLMQPQHADVHVHLGDALKRQGKFKEALVHMEEALRLKPDYAFAYWNLAQFARNGMYRFQEEDLRRAHSLLQSGELPLVEASLLHLSLADLLDHRGDYDAAFSHYKQGNALRKEWLRQTNRAFDAPAHRAMIDGLIANYDESCFRRARVTPSSSELPIFVVGMPRSGTTLVTQIISNHSQVAGAGELRDLALLVSGQGRHKESFANCLARMSQVDDGVLRDLAEGYLKRLARHAGSKDRVIDKMPDNFLLMGLIAILYPRCRIIHCRRDPMDVCLSCFFQNFGGVPCSWSLEDLGEYHRQYERLMTHWKHVLPIDILEVRYEDLVAKQETVTRELIAFCGLPWEDRCLSFHENPRPVKTSSALQVRRPMYSSSVGRAKKYAAHLEPLRRATGLAPTVSHHASEGQTSSFAKNCSPVGSGCREAME